MKYADDTTFGFINSMRRTINSTEFEKLNANELLDLISSDFHSATSEKLATVNLQLETAHKCDVQDEELEFALRTIKNVRKKFEEHVGKEERLLFPLLSVHKKKHNIPDNTKDVTGFIAELKEEHQWIKNQFSLMRKATHEYQCPIDSFPSHKLAYAQLNDLEQDFNRLFFVEEQYIFPRILRDHHS